MAHSVCFITSNANKLQEVKAILEPSIKVQSQSIDLEEMQGSVEEVTLSKCQRAADAVSETAGHTSDGLAEFTHVNYIGEWASSSGGYCTVLQRSWRASWCLYVSHRPHGAENFSRSKLVLRKWFLSSIGLDGLNNLLAAYSDKSADAVCTFGYSRGRGQTPILFQGRCSVSLALPSHPSTSCFPSLCWLTSTIRVKSCQPVVLRALVIFPH